MHQHSCKSAFFTKLSLYRIHDQSGMYGKDSHNKSKLQYKFAVLVFNVRLFALGMRVCDCTSAAAGSLPDVNCGSVMLTRQQQLRRPVPPRDHVLCHEVPLRAAYCIGSHEYPAFICMGAGCKKAFITSIYLVLAKPKSQILRSQEAFSRRLLGFRSLCSTLAVWMNFSPLKI